MDKPKAYVGDGNYIFISYSHDDQELVESDISWLQQKGCKIWYDNAFVAGDNWESEAFRKIRSSQCIGVIFYLSKRSIISKPMSKELEFAERFNKRFFSVNIEGETADKIFDGIGPELCEEDDITGCNIIRRFPDSKIYIPRSLDPQDVSHLEKLLNDISNWNVIDVSDASPDSNISNEQQAVVDNSHNMKNENAVMQESQASNPVIARNLNYYSSNRIYAGFNTLTVDGFSLISSYIRTVFSQCNSETLRMWCNPDRFYDLEDPSFTNQGEMIEALTHIYLQYCAPVTAKSIVTTFNEILLEANLPESSLKEVCTKLGVDSVGRKNVLHERLVEEFAGVLDRVFPEGRNVYVDNPECPPGITKLVNAVVDQLSMDQLKEWLEEFNVDSSIRRNSRKDMTDVLCRIYGVYIPQLTQNGRRKFFNGCFSQFNEQQIKTICEETDFDTKGRRRELIEKLVQAVP